MPHSRAGEKRNRFSADYRTQLGRSRAGEKRNRYTPDDRRVNPRVTKGKAADVPEELAVAAGVEQSGEPAQEGERAETPHKVKTARKKELWR